MRIKSDFHDYYDCIQRFGQDRSLLYVRKKVDFPLETELKSRTIPFLVPALGYGCGYIRAGDLPNSMRFYVVGVAGKIWPVFKLSWDYAENAMPFETFCYSLADIDKIIATRCNKKAQETFHEVSLGRKSRYSMKVRHDDFTNFFDKWQERIQQERTMTMMGMLFQQYPVWNLEARRNNWYVCYNCPLKNFKFFKVMDPATVFQEISMFLGGIAIPQKTIPVPSDKDMVSIKGFDKFSFRKDKKNKKK
jgi:hypothetical protein